MVKKIVFPLLIIMLLFSLVACNGDDPSATVSEPDRSDTGSPVCKHQWNEASCSTPKTCQLCKETEGEALGHTWVNADCDTPKTCSVCGETDGEALGHSTTAEGDRAATCMTKAYCSVCQSEYGDVDPDAHDMAEATCTEPSTCKHGCGHTVGEPCEHSTTAEGDRAATCMTKAYCSVCQSEYGDVDPDAHDMSEATCTEPSTCKHGCGHTEGEPCEHSTTAEGDRAATCMTKAYCSVCRSEYGEVEPDAHDMAAATCTEPSTCKHGCGHTVGEALGHSTTAEGDRAATCMTKAYCSVCQSEYGDVDPDAHDMAEATCTEPSTCKNGCGHTVGEPCEHSTTAEGDRAATCMTKAYCSVCRSEYGEIDPDAHDMAEATCTEPSTCKNGCGHTEGEALGHSWTDADCDTPKTCSVCGTTEGEALGHLYGAWEDSKNATFTEPGEQTKTCSTCGDQMIKRTYLLNDNTSGIKILGERHATGTEFIAMDWSCSGIEFNVNLTIQSSLSFKARSNAPCYFKVFVDGVVYKNGTSDYFTVKVEDTIIELTDLSAGNHTIRLIKVTGYTLARAQVYSVTLEGTIDPTAPADKDLYIEFLGDSISCGWGTIGDHDGSYLSQDGTKAYPYRVAERLNADYSITALSGRGVIYGTDLNFDKNYLHASPSRSNEEYSFARQADIVVINLGTNDRGLHADVNDFEDAYVRLLDNIFKKNGEDCVVYCLWGAMNDAYNTYIQAAIARYQEQNPEAQIETLPLPQATFTEAGGHPSEGDNTRYMMMLEAKIKATYPGFTN